MKTSIPLLALLLLAGCAPQDARVASPVAPATTAAQKPDRRVVLDPALSGSLRVADVRTETSPAGILEFQVDVQNLTRSVKTINYQIDWLDGDGFSLGINYNDLHWLLLPHETGPLTMTAPTPLAKDFRLEFHPRAPLPSPTPP